MNNTIKLPFFVRASFFLLGLYFFVSILYVAQEIILPLIYATIVAILMSPLVSFLVRKGVNRAVSVTAVLLLAILIITGLIALLSSQAALFHHTWPKLLDKLQDLLKETVIWASGFMNIRAHKINAWITDITGEFIKSRNATIGVTLTSLGSIIAAAVLTPAYIFMILFYQPHLLGFIHKVFGAGNDNKVSEILIETKTIIQSYIAGLFAEFVIIAVMNSIGLLALGIEYAILLGVIGAMLNVVPIIGGIICMALFIIIAMLTKSAIYVVYVIGLYALIQFIDNHYIFPKIVGSKVKLNVLISVIAVIAADALWGVAGMFIAIPITAIVKLILDRIDSLEPWGYLMGSPTSATGSEGGFSLKKIINYFTTKKTKSK